MFSARNLHLIAVHCTDSTRSELMKCLQSICSNEFSERSRIVVRTTTNFVFVYLSTLGQARLVFERRVLPIFELANVSVKQICTESAGHAQKFIREQSLDEYDGLICVGGDGMFSELCHGLLLKTLSEENKNIDDLTVHLSRPNIRIGIIPAGSTDAVVFGTTGLNDPITSALQIIVGESLSIDITTVNFYSKPLSDRIHQRICSIPCFRFTMSKALFVSWRRCCPTDFSVTLSDNQIDGDV